MGFGHLAFNLLYSNDYVNTSFVAVQCWFSRASREPYVRWARRERNLKFLNTGLAKHFYMIAQNTNSTMADGIFWKWVK